MSGTGASNEPPRTHAARTTQRRTHTRTGPLRYRQSPRGRAGDGTQLRRPPQTTPCKLTCTCTCTCTCFPLFPFSRMLVVVVLVYSCYTCYRLEYTGSCRGTDGCFRVYTIHSYTQKDGNSFTEGVLLTRLAYNHTHIPQYSYRAHPTDPTDLPFYILYVLSTFSLHSLHSRCSLHSLRSRCVLRAFFYCRPLACTWLLSSSVQVDLSDNRLSPSTIGRVLLALRESGQGKGLLTLNLSRNVLGVEGARALVTLCEDGSAPVLRELRLDHMEIRDQVSTC